MPRLDAEAPLYYSRKFPPYGVDARVDVRLTRRVLCAHTVKLTAQPKRRILTSAFRGEVTMSADDHMYGADNSVSVFTRASSVAERDA
jgi:hypothetical protein